MEKSILLGYRRKSSVRDTADLVSPEQQTHSVELYVAIHLPGMVIEWYEDLDRSAREEKGRPGWLNLMHQLERPEVAGVIAWSFDRLYRNVHQFLTFLNRLEQLDRRLIVVRESLDTSTPIGRAIVTILMVIAQLESDQTSERMKTGINYRREVQGRHWGPTPFGCDRDDQGQLIPSTRGYWLNPLTSEAKNGQEPPGEPWEERKYYDGLRLIYEWYGGGGQSYDSITVALNTGGWRFVDRHGQPRLFDRDDVRRSVAYWRLFRGELPTGKIQRKKGQIFPGGHQPVLPVELCDQVGKMLVSRGRGEVQQRESQKRLYLLSNSLYCGTCQKKLRGAVDHGLAIYRHHGAKGDCPERWVYADQIEAEVLDYLIQLTEAKFLTEVRAEANRLAREAFSLDDTNRGRLAELDRQRERLNRLEDLYLDGGIDRQRYDVKRVEINEIIDRIENELYTASQLTNINAIVDRLVASISELKTATGETQKALITSIFERLEVIGGKVVHFVPRPWVRGFF